MDWRRAARYVAPQVEDAASYLARLKRPLRAPVAPDMSLDSPLFRRMYDADRAYEQLAKGRTPNLRNAGGDLARIAGQAIRDENAAASAARSMPFLERALTNDPDGLLRYAGPLAAIGTTAAGGGLAIQNALEDRLRRAEEAKAMAAAAAIRDAQWGAAADEAGAAWAEQSATTPEERAIRLAAIEAKHLSDQAATTGDAADDSDIQAALADLSMPGMQFDPEDALRMEDGPFSAADLVEEFRPRPRVMGTYPSQRMPPRRVGGY